MFLTLLEYVGVNKHQKRLYRYQCVCGNTTIALGTEVKSGHTKSCGCYQKSHNISHGKHHTKEYQCWADMKQRCLNTKYKQYADYGGRGITVCDSWLSFENFYADMGDRPEGLTLERVDNNSGYSKENCVWADRTTQNRNKRAAKRADKEVNLC